MSVNTDRLARTIEPQVRAEFVAVWRTMQDRYASLPLLTRAIAERRSNLIQHDLPWQGLINDLYTAYKAILLGVFQKGGQAQFAAFPRKAASGPAFDIRHPEAEAWARKYAAALVEGLTNETRIAMANAVADFIRLQIPPAEGARMLRSMLGLTDRYAQAVVNFQNELRAQGYSDAYIQTKADLYATRLLNQRALTVARTESLRPTQEGQRQAYNQAVEQGVLQPSRTMREWVTAADELVCPICQPMDGQLTTLADPWDTEVGPVQIPSDSHPNCRCQAVLVFADDQGQFPSRNPRSPVTGNPAPPPRSLRPRVTRDPS